MVSDPIRVKEIFLKATEQLDDTAQVAYLDGACGGDVTLRDRVEALLRSHDPAGSFLGTPAAALPKLHYSEMDSSRQDGSPRSPNRELDTDGLQFLTPSARPDSLGRLGHYEVLQVLGKGGFGIVFRAFDETLQRVVAIKMLAPSLAATSPARKRFLREARSSAKVRHENVVQVYAVEEQPLPYLVTEFIPGETLQQRLDRNGPLEVSEVVQIGRQIAAGLAAAHDTGLIHRDIKPANILIEAGPNEHVKITDFGLARAADDASLTQSGMVAGTPTYMAPEQARGETLDHRADLFSLGSVLYTMCSGRPPFRANNTFAVLKRVVEDTPRPIPEIIPEVPLWLCEIITRLHAKNPADRFATSREVADLLAPGAETMQRPNHESTSPAIAPVAEMKLPTGEASTKHAETPKFALSKGRSGLPIRLWTVCAAVLLLLVGGLGFSEVKGVTDFRGTIIRLFSPDGTLVIEVDDPDVSIQVDESDVVIKGAGTNEIRLRPGQYKVQASKDGVVLKQQLVTVAKNGREVVSISREGRAGGQASSDRRGAEYALSIGGTVIILQKGKERLVWAGNPVPSEPFDLRVVSLIGNQLANDAGVDNFKGCKYLTNIDLENTNITAAKIWELKNALPSCKIEWDGDIKLLPGSADRRAAEYVLSIGVTLSIKGGGLNRPIYTRGALPKGAFDLRNVNLDQNPHVTDADLGLFKDCSRLESLAVGGTQVTDAGLAHLRDSKQITGLDLSGTEVTDAGLSLFKDHLSLRGLNLKDTRITDAGLAHFQFCQSLVSLNLSNTQVSDEGLSHFKYCKNLMGIWLAKTNVSDAGMAHLSDDNGYIQIDLADTQVSDAGLVHFKQCNALAQLHLSGTKVSDTGIAYFKGCENLALLEIARTQVGDAGLTHLKDCKHLNYLDLAGSQVSDAGLARLVDFPKLYGINVKQAKVTEAGVKKLAASLPTCQIQWDGDTIEPTVNTDADRRVVEWLRLGHGGMSANVFVDGRELLIYFPYGVPTTPFELRRLTIIRHAKFTNDSLAIFRGLRHLTHLNIRDCNVGNAVMSVFRDCTQLKELQLSGTGVTDEVVAQLARFSKLEYLNLDHTATTEEAVRKFAVAMPKCKLEWRGNVIAHSKSGNSP